MQPFNKLFNPKPKFKFWIKVQFRSGSAIENLQISAPNDATAREQASKFCTPYGEVDSVSIVKTQPIN